MKNFANDFSFTLPPETERRRLSSSKRRMSTNMSMNRAKSEIARQQQRDGARQSQKTRIMELDAHNIVKVQEPAATKTVEQYMIPEGMAGTESSLGILSQPSLKWELSDGSSPRDWQKVYEASKRYKFKLDDISKYSQRLKPKDMNWKFERSAMGKLIPSDEARMRRLQKAAFINRLEELKAAADWAESPIYYMYERHGRWLHQNESIYSDVECKQLYSLFKSMRGNDANAEDIRAEHERLIKEHEAKTFRTTEVIMNQLNL